MVIKKIKKGNDMKSKFYNLLNSLYTHSKSYLYAMYLGGALSIANVNFTDIKFYIIIVPTILLVSIFNEE